MHTLHEGMKYLVARHWRFEIEQNSLMIEKQIQARFNTELLK